MLKLYINTNIDLNLTELKEFYIDPIVNKTNKRLKTRFNTYFNELWGDFDQIRELSPKSEYDARCYITSTTHLVNSGIENHYGMYDILDQDGILDFYAGVPPKLDRRAKKNNFKTNEAWLIVHEMCHGLCQKLNIHDATHAMEEQGRLKELFNDCHNRLLKQKVNMLQQITLLERVKQLLWSIKNYKYSDQ